MSESGPTQPPPEEVFPNPRWEFTAPGSFKLPSPPSENDLRIDYYDNASPGDAYRVTCRIVHTRSGVVATSDDQRNRLMAKRQAFDRLLAQLT